MYSLLLSIIYLAFISLGLPDSLLGAAWPIMYGQLQVPISYAGVISMIIAINTVISSLQSDRLTKKFSTGKVTAISAAMTAAAILGFSFSSSFWMLCLFAIPYGLGAGSVDAAINNYVALHYSSKHMSWLHCMWGVGTIISPYVMGFALSSGNGWNTGYRWVGMGQLALTVILFISIPLWNRNNKSNKKVQGSSENHMPLSLRQIITIKGAKQVMITFFCYCALEQTAMLWASSYMVLHNGINAEKAANLASLFFIGITVGRAVNGFLMMKFSDTQMIRVGQVLIGCGIVMLFLPLGNMVALSGFIVIGLGCAPVYPCIIHSTPYRFGEDKSQALIGVQMASAYVGTSLMPPLFGLIANNISVSLLPVYLVIILALMVIMHEILVKKTKKA